MGVGQTLQDHDGVHDRNAASVINGIRLDGSINDCDNFPSPSIDEIMLCNEGLCLIRRCACAGGAQ
jgi:hypothetical protein